MPLDRLRWQTGQPQEVEWAEVMRLILMLMDMSPFNSPEMEILAHAHHRLQIKIILLEYESIRTITMLAYVRFGKQGLVWRSFS